jgi:CDP-glycerol glycerophosphotransferase
MFDFSVTGKPMIFFAPDLETYSGSLRGTYFDLTAEAPGPVVRSTDEVIAAIKDSEAVLEDYEDAYTAWQRRFNPFDDGHAAERAVDALLGDD